LRLPIGRAILNLRRIEHDDIGDRAVANHASVAKAEDHCREARHRPNGIWQVDDVAIANVHRELPREGTIAARMRLALPGRRQLAVRARHRPELPHDPHDVVV
jgi:hypothetical protein